MLREKLAELVRGTSAEDLLDGLESVVRELVSRYEPLSVLVTGSLARREFVRGMSDIDVLVVTERRVAKRERFLLRAVRDVDVEVTVLSLDEVERAASSGNQFVIEAVERGVEVYGSAKPLLLRTLGRARGRG